MKIEIVILNVSIEHIAECSKVPFVSQGPIYHKFSNDDISYKFNGRNVKVMLEFFYDPCILV